MKNKKGFLQGLLLGAFVMVLVAGFVSCGLVRETGTNTENASVTDRTDEKIEKLRELIDETYLGDVDEEHLEEGIYKGFVDGLNDPYSVYYDKEEAKELLESVEGEFEGIGASLIQNSDTGIITLLHIYQDSPAMRAGLQDDDILYQVNGEEVTGEDLSEVVSHIRGEKGTTVDLTVLRGEEQEEITVTATRDTIQVQTVDYRMMEDGVGYLAVTEFDSVTYEQYEQALKDLENQGMTGLVVDLRNNPGGSLDIVCEMLDLMLPEGVVVYMEDKEGQRQELFSDEEHQFDLPLAVLVNGYSASASEIYAGAIQDYGIGKIVGTQTYGKGVVQKIFNLDDGSCVKLTIAEYFTPEGRTINGKGITPDVEVAYEADENNEEADNQLDKAIEIIKSEQ